MKLIVALIALILSVTMSQAFIYPGVYDTFGRYGGFPGFWGGFGLSALGWGGLGGWGFGGLGWGGLGGWGFGGLWGYPGLEMYYDSMSLGLGLGVGLGLGGYGKGGYPAPIGSQAPYAGQMIL